jgi:hypothetical protein
LLKHKENEHCKFGIRGEIMQLDYTSREMILEILKKRQIEARREDMAKNARKSIRDYQRGVTSAISNFEIV